MHVAMFGVGNKPSSFIDNQIDALRSAGVTVTVFTASRVAGWRTALFGKTGIVQSLTGVEQQSLRTADILHFQWPTDYLNFRAYAHRANKPTIVSLRGRLINIVPYLPGKESYRRQLQTHMPHCTGYHAVSSAILSEAVDLGVERERAEVIYTPVDTAFFHPAPHPPEHHLPIQIAMVGALIWRKGLEYALQALSQVVEEAPEPPNIVIVGNGDEMDRVEYTISDLGLAPYVTLTGHLDRIGVRSVLHNSHLLLHASLSEGIANVAIEAMACELPVITTSAGGMDEAVAHGIEGLLVPPRNTQAMAKAIQDLIIDPVRRTAMGRAGRQRVLKQFSLDKHSEKMIGLYERAIAVTGRV